MRSDFTTPAGAIVDPLDKVNGGGERYWRVTVTTPPGWPRQAYRVYTILAFTEDQAGQEGLGRFGKEIDGRAQSQIWMG